MDLEQQNSNVPTTELETVTIRFAGDSVTECSLPEISSPNLRWLETMSSPFRIILLKSAPCRNTGRGFRFWTEFFQAWYPWTGDWIMFWLPWIRQHSKWILVILRKAEFWSWIQTVFRKTIWGKLNTMETLNQKKFRIIDWFRSRSLISLKGSWGVRSFSSWRRALQEFFAPG